MKTSNLSLATMGGALLSQLIRHPEAKSLAKQVARALSVLFIAMSAQTTALAGSLTLSNTAELEWGAVTQGPVTLYPSEIMVSRIPSQTVTQIEVTLNNVSHTFPDDLDILLVGPQGQQTILMSDVGGGDDLDNVDLTFSPSATLSLPDFTLIAPGTYLPTNPVEFFDSFPAPAPSGSSSAPADLSVFNGTDPNGTWQLFVFDDAGGDTGSIAGWSLTLIFPDALVSNTDDAGPGSLRAAISDTPDEAIIGFSPDVFNAEDNKTITLSSPLSISNRDLTIDASSVGGVTIDRGGTTSKLFNNAGSGSLTLNALNLTGASSNAVLNSDSSLQINNCAVYRNQGDGAIFNDTGGVCSITNSTIAFNTGEFGVAFLSRGSSATLTHVTIANNSATGGSAGILHENGSLTLDRCLLSNPDSPDSIGPDIGGAGGTIIANTPNFIRSIGSSNSYASSFPPGPLVGTDTDPIEPLLIGDNITGLAGEPLFNFGGPTLALMPELGSPVINASTATSGVDQRGVAPVGNRDLGAIETTWNDNITPTPPTGFFADITTPATAISNFPPDLSLNAGAVISLLDGLDSLVSPSTEINWGLTLSPTGPNFSISGISLNFADDAFLNAAPASFLLLGSNDLNSFQPLVSATLEPFSTSNEQQTIFLASPLPHFPHYRLIFGRSVNPNQAFFRLGEIELLGAPLPPFSELRITEFENSNSGGIFSFSLTADTIPGNTYAVFSGSGGLDRFANNTALQLPNSEFTAEAYSSTSPPQVTNSSSDFFRIQEVSPAD